MLSYHLALISQTAAASPESVMEVAAAVQRQVARDFAPIADHRGGAAYRLRAAANLIRRLQWETSSDVPLRVETL